MSTAHERALEAVKKYLLPGDVVEVTSKPNWGFSEIQRTAITAEEFVRVWDRHTDNVILHILAGEGVDTGLLSSVVRRACAVGTRVVILEHNPASPDFRFDVNVSESRILEIQRELFACGMWGNWLPIDGRNMVMVVTTIRGLDESFWSITRKDLERGLGWQYKDGLPEKDRNVFCLSSEAQRDGRRLLSKETVAEIDRLPENVPVYMVIGGLMFLNFIAETEKRELVLFDKNLAQVLYAVMVCEIIKGEPTVESFKGVVEGRKEPHARLDKLGTLINCETLLGWLRSAKRRIERPDKGTVWVNLVREGHWLEKYEKVRERLREVVWFRWCGIEDLKPAPGSVVYTSTLEPRLWERLAGHCRIVEAYSERDVPRIRAKKQDENRVCAQ